MPIDPCAEGCLNHNIGAGALPTAGDDPCNTAGNGYFCAGSYWLVNAGVDGDCERLYLRTGGDCNVDQWLEISLGEVIEDIVDPVDGADCCPPSTLWHNTVSGGLWMSYNYDGLCRWCEICGAGIDDTHTAVQNSAISPNIVYDDPGGPLNIPGVTTAGLIPFNAAIVNPSATRSMAVQVVFQGYSADFAFQHSTGPISARYAIQPFFYINAIQLNVGADNDAFFSVVNLQTITIEQDFPTSSWTWSGIIGPGALITASMDMTLLVLLPHNADVAARIAASAATISIMGSTI